MTEYLFVWDKEENMWPVRYVVSRGGLESASEPDVLVEGVVTGDESEQLIDRLRTRFPEPRYVVARMSATSWQTVEEDFPGLHRH